MRKEIVFAIVIGAILGTVILYGLKIAKEATQKAITTNLPKATEQTSSLATVTAAPTPPTAKLTITYPQDQSVLFEKNIIVRGKAPANSDLTVIYEGSETIVTSDNKGNYETNISLVGGENEIRVTTIIGSTQEDQTVTVIYTTSTL